MGHMTPTKNGQVNAFFFSLPSLQASPEDTSYTQVIIPMEDMMTEAANSIGVHVTST
jgi:flagellar hook-associated protein FlgK